MKITIKLGGPLRLKVKEHDCGELQVDLPAGSRVSDAILALGLDLGDVRVIMKNHLAIRDDEFLADGDRLGLFPRELAYNTMTAISFFNPLARQDCPEK